MKHLHTFLAIALLSGCVHVNDKGTAPKPDKAEQEQRFGDIFVPPNAGTVTVAGTLTSLGSISTSVTPGTAAANLGKAEDAASGSGDTGNAVWTRRIDTEASSADTSGDYATLDSDSLGRLRTVPGTATSTTYASSVTSASTWTGSTITTTAYRLACFLFTLTNTSNPIGTLEIDGSIDGSTWTPIYLDANKPVYYIGSTYTAFTGGATIAINDPAGNVKIQACVEAITPNLRMVYTRTSGGAASTINAQYSLRAN